MNLRILKHFFTFTVLLVTLSISAVPSGVYDWSKAKKITPEILHAAVENNEIRPLKINVLRIDLSHKAIKFITTTRDADYGKSMPDFPSLEIDTKREKVSEFLLRNRKNGLDMVAAVNASPWSPWENPFTHLYASMALVISDGIVVSDTLRTVPCFYITCDNQFFIGNLTKDFDRSKLKIALSGFEIILVNGKNVAGNKNLDPRTIYGLSADKRYLYWVSVDGRQKNYSEGISTVEGADYLRYFGADSAINMDGGGSNTLVIFDYESEKPLKLNNRRLGYQRPVGNAIGVYYEYK